MTSEQANKALPLITAFAEGKTVEFLHSSGIWAKLKDADFTGDLSRYRIKPEPRRFFFTESKDGSLRLGSMSPAEGEQLVEFVEVMK